MYRKNVKKIFKTAFCLAAFGLSLLCSTQASAAGDIKVNESTFPDAVFREYVLDYIAGTDGVLSEKERSSVKNLDFYYEGVTSFKGIEHFTNLQYLFCEGNELTSLDLRKLVNLKEVECADNKLTSLKVSGLSKLEKLICSDNNLTSLSLTTLPKLEELECSGNKLSKLNVKSLSNLKYLVCSSNQIQALDLSGMKVLQNVDCDGNGMNTLKLGSVPALTTLLCSVNDLTSLNISGAPLLRVLYCYQNSLKSLDCTSNTKLQELEIFTNQLKTLNLSGVTSLVSINCSANQISVLDVKSAAGLVNLIADNNCLPALDLSKNKKLKQVSLQAQIASANVLQDSSGCKVDLSASGFAKKRATSLSSGSLYKNGISWKSTAEIPAARVVTYVYKTGRSGVNFTVTLNLGKTTAWKPTPGNVNMYQAVNKKGKKICVKWNALADVTGYEIAYSTSSKFTKSKTTVVKIKKASTKSRTIKKLKKNKTYYVRMRAYTTYNGKKYCGAYCTKKKVVIKK